MTAIIRNVLACIIGVLLGGTVNMAIVVLGPLVIPPPPGVDVTNMEAMSASMHLFEPKHFIVPFVAHAVGTLIGSLAAFLIAASHKTAIAFLIGTLFFIGGIAACFMIPAPTWFIIVDLVGAYFPMAWISTRMGSR